jgi:hypothetical protein
VREISNTKTIPNYWHKYTADVIKMKIQSNEDENTDQLEYGFKELEKFKGRLYLL